MEQTINAVETPLNRTYSKFVELVNAAYNQHSNSMRFAGQTLTLEFGETPSEVKINGKQYTLGNTSANRASVAGDGLLGQKFVFKGRLILSQIEFHKQKHAESRQRIAEEKAKAAQRQAARDKARQFINSLWGPYADAVWDLRREDAHVPMIANVAKKLLDLGVGPENFPSTAAEAARKYQVTEVPGLAWLSVSELVAQLWAMRQQLKKD